MAFPPTGPGDPAPSPIVSGVSSAVGSAVKGAAGWPWSQIADVGSNLVGSALNWYGAKRANEMSEKMAEKQMDFQRSSVREQMDFQERMAGSYYQRLMADMKKAGINPILAFGQGAPSTPSGSSAGGAKGEARNVFAGAVSSAVELRRASAEIQNLRAQNDFIRAQTLLAKSQVGASSARAVKDIADTVGSSAGVLLPLIRKLIFKV